MAFKYSISVFVSFCTDKAAGINQIAVRNKNIKLEIVPESMENRFSFSIPIILSGETYTADAVEFLNDDGIPFNPDKIKPKEFWILCDTPIRRRGSYLVNWE